MNNKNPVIQPWSKEELIRVAKQSQPDLVHCFIPTINLFYADFREYAAIEQESFKDYRSTSLDQKKAVFQDIGFDVLCVTPHAIDAMRFVSDQQDNNPSLHDQYLDNNRNIFMVWIENSYKDLIFIIEYTDLSDPLAKHVVSPVKLAKYRKNQRAAKTMLKNMRKKK